MNHIKPVTKINIIDRIHALWYFLSKFKLSNDSGAIYYVTSVRTMLIRI